jgi:hypothetical protein
LHLEDEEVTEDVPEDAEANTVGKKIRNDC